MDANEEVRLLLAAMREKIMTATPETRISCDDAVMRMSGRVAQLAAQCSLPELDWFKRAIEVEAPRA